MPQLKIGDITIDVIKKKIRNVHLSVHPPDGRVRITAPMRMNLDTIREFVVSKLSWIKKHQAKLRHQVRETKREFLNLENHYFNGENYLLNIIEQEAPPKVVLNHRTIDLYVRPGSDVEKRRAVLESFYRQRLKDAVPSLILKWEAVMGVKVEEFGIKKMRTRWGTCNRRAARIWLNLELAKKPPEYLEYIVVHEMVHLLERTHGPRFVAFMDLYVPKWRFYKQEINRFPLGYADWER